MTTVAELDRQKRWYAAAHTDSLTRRTEAVIRLADQEQEALRAEVERLRGRLDDQAEGLRVACARFEKAEAALKFKQGIIDDLSREVERLEGDLTEVGYQ